jgi:predicted dehydrogenase
MKTIGSAPIRVGIIGCSSIARRRFIPALLSSKKATLQIIGSRELSKASEFAKLFQCVKYGNYDDVIFSNDVDLIYISTPPTERKNLLEAAIRAGKHVLCEKPLLTCADATREILDLAENYGVRLFENYAYLSHPQHAKVKELLSKNIIGRIREVSVSYTYPLPAAHDIRLKPQLGGGVINDSLGYPVSLVIFLFDDAVKITRASISHSNSLGVDKNCEFEAIVGEGVQYKARVGMDEEYSSTYVLTGEYGAIEVGRAFSVDSTHAATIIINTASGREVETIANANQFQLYLDQCIVDLSDVRKLSEKNTLQIRSLMDAIIQAAKPIFNF